MQTARDLALYEPHLQQKEQRQQEHGQLPGAVFAPSPIPTHTRTHARTKRKSFAATWQFCAGACANRDSEARFGATEWRYRWPGRQMVRAWNLGGISFLETGQRWGNAQMGLILKPEMSTHSGELLPSLSTPLEGTCDRLYWHEPSS